jgi:hypothetical protein
MNTGWKGGVVRLFASCSPGRLPAAGHEAGFGEVEDGERIGQHLASDGQIDGACVPLLVPKVSEALWEPAAAKTPFPEPLVNR